MPVGRPPQQEAPLIVRQIPRAQPLDAVEVAEEPPNGPSERFSRTDPPEPEPGTLRPIRALIGDTFRFIVRQWHHVVVVSLPALMALLLVWLVYRWTYEPAFDDDHNAGFELRLVSAATFSWVVMGIASYLFSTAVLHLVVQRERGGMSGPGPALSLALRRLPRVIAVNLVYGVPVAVVFAPLLFWLVPRFLFERDQFELFPWAHLVAGVIAYAAPQINVYFTALKVEDRRPKFRRARQLVNGQRAATLGRVLLCQIVRVAFQAAWAVLLLEIHSFAWFGFGALNVVVTTTLLTTAFTLLYVDLAEVRADEATVGDGATTVACAEAT